MSGVRGMAESGLVVWRRILRILLLCRCTVSKKRIVLCWHHSCLVQYLRKPTEVKTAFRKRENVSLVQI